MEEIIRIGSELGEHVYHVGRAGPNGRAFAIGSGPLRYKVESDGELFLYVNDAVLGLPGDLRTLPYRWPKGRNVGTAIVKVAPLE